VSYATSFEPAVGTTYQGTPFTPLTGHQYEVGVKYRPNNSDSLFTVAFFDLTQENVLVTDDNAPVFGYQVQQGKIHSQGLELEARAHLTPALTMLASYTYTRARVKETTDPASLNKQVPLQPKHQAALWVDYPFTSYSLNLYREVFHPAMSLVSQVTPSPFVSRPFSPTPIEPEISFGEILTLATKAAQEKNWDRPPGGIFYARDLGFYSVAYFHEDAEDGNGMEIANMYFDGKDAAYLGEHLPWHGTAADVFTQLQFPLHSGRILGLPGRILMSVMGLVVAMLSVTGIIIWARKRRARKLAVG